MRYIMATSWHNHWDKLVNNSTLFTKGMLKVGMNKSRLVDGTETIFIKKRLGDGKVEGCWKGKVCNFKDEIYNGRPAVRFRVSLEKKIKCPNKYLTYPLGWFCEDNPKIDKTAKHDNWKGIEKDFDVSKKKFGRQINFVKDTFTRKIIFRDVEQAYALNKLGFYKPAVILSGGVIEELLRLFLMSKNISTNNKSFEELIKLCQERGFMKAVIGNVASGVRQFRNLVHLAVEKSEKHSISKATASANVALIFTIINDF